MPSEEGGRLSFRSPRDCLAPLIALPLILGEMTTMRVGNQVRARVALPAIPVASLGQVKRTLRRRTIRLRASVR